MADLTYQEKLKDPRWQKKRLNIFERDGWKCRVCGNDKDTLHVHHKIYKKGEEPWDTPDKFLLTLCESCHDEESLNRAEHEGWLLGTLKELGFLCHDIFSLHLELETLKYNYDEREFYGLEVTNNRPLEIIELIRRFARLVSEDTKASNHNPP